MSTFSARDRFVLEKRPPRPQHDPWTAQGVIVEDERTAAGDVARTATVFLTGRECLWRCVMCDLWKHTIAEDTPPGAIPAQLAAARERLTREPAAVTRIKLYNAGSFFDPRAVPESDYLPMAAVLRGFAHVVVESHPAMIGDRVDRWIQALHRQRAEGGPAQLEVAMGLETVHPEALERLHKQMTVGQFEAAADALARRGVAVRAFLLIAPPFIPIGDQLEWLLRSVDAAFACGASVVTLIPTRTGNGALDALAADGAFRQPSLEEIEQSALAALERSRGRGRLFVDLWDLERFAGCLACLPARRRRLDSMNLEQRMPPLVRCDRHTSRVAAHPPAARPRPTA